MVTRRRQRFIHWQVLWMVSALVALVALGVFSLPLFFVVSFVGFVIVVELTTPVNVAPRWRARLRWITILGFLILMVIVVRKILKIVPSGLIP
ncbi:hypothetical protein [Haladaptatus salinisoli]|uniref:hypothetical protein n=1 Tax=Haladaptatus salinisoli TaxID=2884876 RepID=UPI001D0B8FEE|nr:hypothetical protein [Haladaptatus salinisoli]